jgi:hypothetical protein
MATVETIVKTLKTFSTAYYSPSRSDADLQILTGVWCSVLADTNEDALRVATAERLNSAEKFMPPPGWLRTRAIELSGQGAQDRAAQAWQMFLDSDYGRDKQYMTDEIMLRCVRELGGFDEIGNTDSDKIHFVRDRFIQKYIEYSKRDDAFKALPAGQRDSVRLALEAK